ncbi:LpqB family beta-propeller domain-containing protein [Flaviflexus equikiangi]|uniref:GerMN domain-containing protein n=1 Tax=Flaviflexus equikiangi TaxID=2758573 RepID=A0ABS2TGQ6_9ACTO|nr:LpqB family beta-propeller domain-containing protein [Flaviflexus equikiangi]MBM9433838.1 GerMN domain-containing protein [Flaviflexus equikiangi]
MKRLCAVLCAVTLLSACTSLPTEGPVNATRAPDGTNQTVGFYANGPREGSTPEEIVYGFLTASAAGLSDDFEVARQFLSPQASEEWRPLEEVRIYADARVPVTTRTETQAVRLSLGAEGSIDPSGRFMMSSSDAVITTDFSLARNADGEWRIIDLDNGLLISATLFESQYSKSELHFLTADSQYLVADLRWFPRTTYASAATRELFEGPSEWLSDAVRTAVPPGTTIGSRGISTTSGTATVSLSDEALSVSGYQRALFMAQIEETLTMLSSIQNVELTVDGVPWEVNQSISLSSYPFTESTMLVNVDGRPSLYENGSAVSLSMTDVPTDLEALTIGYGDNPPMVAIADGSRLVTLPNNGSAPVTLLEGDTIGTPSIDIYDWIWAGSGDTIIAFTAEGDRVRLSASWLDGGTVDSIHVSREGARAVVVWHNETNTYMTTTAIIRDGNGEPVALDGALELGAGVDEVLDVAWIDETTVAALATLPGGSNPGIYAVPIGGPITAITEVNGATSITAGSGQGSLVLATENGQILERSGGGWRLLLTDGSSPALPG